jgi:hypothetical protein
MKVNMGQTASIEPFRRAFAKKLSVEECELDSFIVRGQRGRLAVLGVKRSVFNSWEVEGKNRVTNLLKDGRMLMEGKALNLGVWQSTSELTSELDIASALPKGVEYWTHAKCEEQCSRHNIEFVEALIRNSSLYVDDGRTFLHFGIQQAKRGRQEHPEEGHGASRGSETSFDRHSTR